MQFYKHADGSVTVDSFDDEITVTMALLNDHDERVMQVTHDWQRLCILGVWYEQVCINRRDGTVTFRR